MATDKQKLSAMQRVIGSYFGNLSALGNRRRTPPQPSERVGFQTHISILQGILERQTYQRDKQAFFWRQFHGCILVEHKRATYASGRPA
jgi:hypothetical protein